MTSSPFALATTAGAAGLLCGLLLRFLRPLLVRYALARPNARSSHTVPTPQGGGVAVVSGALAAGLVGAALAGIGPSWATGLLAGATILLAIVGGIDDVHPLSPLLRLAAQAIAVAVVVSAGEGRVLPDILPAPVEGACLVLAGIWWVNVVNFMDGIDWMTVTGIGPSVAALALMGLAGAIGPETAFLCAGLVGGLAGFAPANRPVARLFLGDVGSLPIGLLSGAALLDLARGGQLVAALILPLYFLADATVTLILRLRAGERVWDAHRRHFYQRALANGWSVPAVNRTVFGLNAALAGLAGATLVWHGAAVAVPALAGAACLVAATLRRFARSPGSMRGAGP